MDNYFTLSHRKELTAQCTELTPYNIFLTVYWITVHLDWSFIIAKPSASRTVCFTAILRTIILYILS